MKRLFLLLGFSSLIACTNELEESAPSDEVNQITMTVKDFELDNKDSRMSVDVSPSGAVFKWSENDTVGIFPNEGAQAYFPMTNGAGTNQASFTGGGWALKTSSKYAAYYPYNFYNRDLKKIAVNYEGQTQKGNGSTAHLGAYDYMAAVATTPSSGKVNFDFQHLGCLMEIKMTIPEPCKLTYLTINDPYPHYSNTSNGYIDLGSITPKITYNKKRKLILNDIATSSPNEVITLYMMVPPSNSNEDGLEIEVGNEQGVQYVGWGEPNKQYLAGKYYIVKVSKIIDGKTFNGLMLKTTQPKRPLQDSEGNFLIASAANLLWFLNIPYEKWDQDPQFTPDTLYAEQNYKLMTDIEFRNYFHVQRKYVFNGIFDGCGHKIKDYKFGRYIYNGFFERNWGIIKNLVFENPTVDIYSDHESGNIYAGAIVGENIGSIINCGVIGGVISSENYSSSTPSFLGGIAGVSEGTIKGCFVKNTHFICGNYYGVGGIAGSVSGRGASKPDITSTYCDITIDDRHTSMLRKNTIGCFVGGCVSGGFNLNVLSCYYNEIPDCKPLGYSNECTSITKKNFYSFSTISFNEAIKDMNYNLTDTDYIFGPDGTFVKR